jgi:GWxTD domain-containing protein
MKTLFRFFLLFLAIGLVGFCRLQRLEQKLAPDYREFISKVGYIISKEERRTFLELPDEKKPVFIEEFWRRRDPDPDTEENEFKIQYLNRVEMAGKLFRQLGRPGWLTDRGRMYILFGPPTARVIDSAGLIDTPPCRETWHYWEYPLIFLDEDCSGDFRLITSLGSAELTYMHEVNRAQDIMQSLLKRKKDDSSFRFDIGAKIDERTDSSLVARLILKIYYKTLSYIQEGELYFSRFDTVITITTQKGDILWSMEKATEVRLRENELGKMAKEHFRSEIPLLIKDANVLSRLGKESLRLRVTLSSQADNTRKSRSVPFK